MPTARRVQQCGNGARCFAIFVREKNLTRKRTISVGNGGPVLLNCAYSATMKLKSIWVRRSSNPKRFPSRLLPDSRVTPLLIDNKELEIGSVSMGNPHAVLRVKSTSGSEIERLGPLIESHSDFPQHVNVGFMQIVSEKEIKLRVYERSVGETLACGTGACAAVVYGISRGWLSDSVTVALPGGKPFGIVGGRRPAGDNDRAHCGGVRRNHKNLSPRQRGHPGQER